jgi:hypothetical protein
VEVNKIQNRHDGFRYGSGCFRCEICGKLTRMTDETSGTRLCIQCCRESMIENAISDGAIKSEADVCPQDL